MRPPLSLAASQQSVFIMSLTDYNPGIWRDESQTRLGMRRRTNEREPIKDTYTWDLHRLAESLPRERDGSGYRTVRSNNLLWKPLLVEAFNDDSGSSTYASMPTHFTVSPFSHPVATGHLYRADMSLSPLLPRADIYDELGTLQSLGYEGEAALWQATVWPGMPMLLGTTAPATRCHGPVFLNSVTYSVSGAGGLGSVGINANWLGGKIVRSPVMPVNAFDDGDVEVRGYANEYRSASLLDCGFDTSLQSTPAALAEAMSASRFWDWERFAGMTLSMNQQVSMTFTCPSQDKSDKHGARFASIHDRVVEGTVTFIGRDREPLFEGMTPGSTGPVTMYFGSGFFFSMPNVEWSRPKTVLQAGQSYTVEYSFIARAAPTAVTKGFGPETSPYPVSEFNEPTF